MTSWCFYRPLKLVATYQLNTGRSKTKRGHSEDKTYHEEDISTADDTHSMSTVSNWSEANFNNNNNDVYQELENEQNNHQLTSQKLQISQIQLERANREIEIDNEEIKRAQKEIINLKLSNIPLSPQNSPVANRDKIFAKTIETSVRQIYPCCHDKNKATNVLSLLKSTSVFNCKEHFLKEQKAELTKILREIFCPWKLRQKWNGCNQGGINASGCKQISEVQDLQKYKWGLLPHKTPIVQAKKILNRRLANTLIGSYKMNHLESWPSTEIWRILFFRHWMHLSRLSRLTGVQMVQTWLIYTSILF